MNESTIDDGIDASNVYTDSQPQPQLFGGFAPPTANFSHLPHQLIEAFPLFETKAELMVVLYILRHTWGFGDDDKKITVDEFMYGRKRRNGTRIDKGVGMSKPSIIEGLRRAEQHGFIKIETDDSDKGRVKKFYRLRELSDFFTPEVKEFYPNGKESIPRSEKETSRKKKDSVPVGTPRKSKTKTVRPIPVSYGEKSGLTPEELDANAKRLIQESVKQSDKHIAANTDFDNLVQEVRIIPGVSGKLAIQYAHMLSGTAQKGEYKAWNLEKPISGVQFRVFTGWYFLTYPNQGLPKVPKTLHGYICEWQESGEPYGGLNGHGLTQPSQKVNMLDLIGGGE